MIYCYRMALFFRRPIFIYAILLVFLCFFVGGLFLFFADKSRANTVSFHPSTCLGGWRDINYASGKPEASFDAPQDVNNDNAATAASDQAAELYCGDWKGDMPADELVKSAVLRLSWRFSDDFLSVVADSSVEAEVATTTIESFSGGTASVIETISDLFGDASSTEPVVPVLGIPTPTPASDIVPESLPTTTTEVSEPPPTATPAIEQIEQVLLDPEVSDQQSFFRKIIGLSAHAEEEPIAYIEYTLDGVIWKPLAVASRTNLPREIVLPKSDFGSWENLSSLQVKIRRVGTISSYPDLLLDGIAIDIDYLENEIPVIVATPSDPQHFHITDVVSNGYMHASVISDDDQGESIDLQSDFPGSIRFYNDADYSFAMTIGIGENNIVIPAYNFSPGLITTVLTRDPAACEGLSLDECEETEGFVGMLHFRINATALTPIPRGDILE